MTQPKSSYTDWINSEEKRQKAIQVLSRASLPFACQFKRDKRTGKQNSRQWAMLGIIAENQTWHGQKLSSEDWKLIFMNALFGEIRMVPNLANDGFVSLARSSSNLTVQEHCDLTALIEAFAAKNNINLEKPRKEKAA